VDRRAALGFGTSKYCVTFLLLCHGSEDFEFVGERVLVVEHEVGNGDSEIIA
jgi:hypothetical protein